jgi:hypothetical protein
MYNTILTAEAPRTITGSPSCAKESLSIPTPKERLLLLVKHNAPLSFGIDAVWIRQRDRRIAPPWLPLMLQSLPTLGVKTYAKANNDIRNHMMYEYGVRGGPRGPSISATSRY